jgi:hypothetical protein
MQRGDATVCQLNRAEGMPCSTEGAAALNAVNESQTHENTGFAIMGTLYLAGIVAAVATRKQKAAMPA